MSGIVHRGLQLGHDSTLITCPNCKQHVTTSVKYQRARKTARHELGDAAVGSNGLLCCLIPCCRDMMREAHHSCPLCKSYLGKDDPML